MVALWHEKMMLQSQTGSRPALLPDAQNRWAAAVTAWVDDSRCGLLVAEHNQAVVGFIIGCIEDNAPGLAPARIGRIVDLVIDVHSDQSGLGRRLLDPLCAWFKAQEIHEIRVQVSPANPVEQAFWRASGAVEWFDVMWMRI